ncbi:16S rRNA (uracil(1498)-N(3))-methyltransferase [Glaciibacter psychrotolerans]|uniref:Ribosomal RNA small subunit methyltransferase E n=1 Tax=Glaciibacter psychrotolerans TaxID=670054 RepID=A0A7Z0EC09_9MICO|nr:16S rRNA (uracil(1498)-N(3))-methyltransferase [Leifsonia psychrotolerans]NYJ18867.1 16S rRNA (uracil1498-N3)-methyltransferase [Leifsonia psychrotolerans]
MAHFFLDETLSASLCAPGSTVSIGGSEAKHAVTVSRIRPGEQLLLGNGAGMILHGTVVTAEPAELTLLVDTRELTPAATPRIVLVQALAKGDRDELAVQAATELGVDGVIPWTAARSISRWEGAKVTKGRERWASIVREASKQSIRPWLPVVADLVSTKQLVKLATETRMLLLEPSATARLTEVDFVVEFEADVEADVDDAADATSRRDILLIVGPEGGIAPSELDALEAAGATRVRLGDTVLRTSTAGPAALAILNATLRRW